MDADYNRMDVEKLNTSHPGYRSHNVVYGYSDFIKTIFYIHAIGGDALDDVNVLKEQMRDHPGLRLCSAERRRRK